MQRAFTENLLSARVCARDTGVLGTVTLPLPSFHTVNKHPDTSPLGVLVFSTGIVKAIPRPFQNPIANVVNGGAFLNWKW